MVILTLLGKGSERGGKMSGRSGSLCSGRLVNRAPASAVTPQMKGRGARSYGLLLELLRWPLGSRVQWLEWRRRRCSCLGRTC